MDADDTIRNDVHKGEEEVKEGWQKTKAGAEHIGHEAKEGVEEAGRDIRDTTERI